MKALDAVILDASVFVADAHSHEAHHGEAHALLEALAANGTLIVLPAIAMPEVASAIARGVDDGRLGIEAARLYSAWPGVRVVPVTEELGALAIETAANFRLRGCDAVYVALAVQQRAVLVTLDKEQHARAAEAVDVRTPASALST